MLLVNLTHKRVFFIQMQKDLNQNIGVLFVKIADLLHNLSSIKHLKKEKQEKWLHELKDGYIPILNKSYTDMPDSYQKMYDRMLDILADRLDVALV